MPKQAASSSNQAASSSDSQDKSKFINLKKAINQDVIRAYSAHYNCASITDLMMKSEKNNNKENVSDALLLLNVIKTCKSEKDVDIIKGACLYPFLRIHNEYKDSFLQPTRSKLYVLLGELLDIPVNKGQSEERHAKIHELFPALIAFNDELSKENESLLFKALTLPKETSSRMFGSNDLTVNEFNNAPRVLENLAALMEIYAPKNTNEEESEEGLSMKNS